MNYKNKAVLTLSHDTEELTITMKYKFINKKDFEHELMVIRRGINS